MSSALFSALSIVVGETREACLCQWVIELGKQGWMANGSSKLPLTPRPIPASHDKELRSPKKNSKPTASNIVVLIPNMPVSASGLRFLSILLAI
jgi:hypothetical protein